MGRPVSAGAGTPMLLQLRYSAGSRYPLTQNAWNELPWNVAEIDIDGSYDLDQNAFIAPASGEYAVGLCARIRNEDNNGSTFEFSMRHVVDGVPAKDSTQGDQSFNNLIIGSNGTEPLYFSDILELSRGQLVTAQVYVGTSQKSFDGQGASAWAIARVT